MDLLLVGAGHAHLHLIDQAPRLRAAGWRLRLLSPATFHYSGVASAVAAGALPPDAGRVDVRGLAARRGVPHTLGRLTGLDVGSREALTDAGDLLRYDVISLNVGSESASPGVAPGHDDAGLLRVKPLADLDALQGRIRRAAQGPGGATVTVVGAGSSGVELAAHLATRTDVARVQLLEAGEQVVPGLPGGARRHLRRLLDHRGVDVRTGASVVELTGSVAVTADGTTLRHDVVLLAAGLRAPAVVADAGLGDTDGVPVRATLQHRDLDEVYAVGDCAHFLPRPLPRVGVHGVRQGPVLLSSLLARAAGEPLPTYTPQRRWLAVLDLGGGRGLATRGGWWWSGRSAWWLKRWIDRRWIATYQG
ncbi:FAD-dependent oxidoreductase [Nocardioidaceae bacterium]|nr:FAD-dependent oxidoreductase [Nocardioidaceae bacterium]